jgi:hypothetical protein
MNKTIIFVLFATLFFSFSIFALDPAKNSGLVDTLTKDLKLKPEQATGAAGSVFSLAKSKMNATDFTKLAGGFPEMDTLLKATPKTDSGSPTSALTGAIGSLSGPALMASQFKTLGISPEVASKIVPEVLNFVKGKEGQAAMDLLSKAIK